MGPLGLIKFYVYFGLWYVDAFNIFAVKHDVLSLATYCSFFLLCVGIILLEV